MDSAINLTDAQQILENPCREYACPRIFKVDDSARGGLAQFWNFFCDSLRTQKIPNINHPAYLLPWWDIMSTLGCVQYCGGYHE